MVVAQDERTLSYAGGDSELLTRLREVPLHFSQILGARVALRVLPLFAPALLASDDAAAVRAFHLGFFLWASAKYPGEITDGPAWEAQFREIRGDTLESSRSAADLALRTAVITARMSLPTPDQPDLLDVVDASMSAAHAAGDDSAVAQIRQSILRDIGALAKIDSGSLIDEPLWPLDVRDKKYQQANFPLWVREAFDSVAYNKIGEDGDWKPYVDWYRALLPDTMDAKPTSAFGQSVDHQLLALPDSFWSRDPKEVMADVKRLVQGESILFRTEPSESSPTAGTAEPAQAETRMVFLSDVHDPSVDYLGRAKQAFVLAGRLNVIWNNENASGAGSGENLSGINREETSARTSIRPGFVVHIDAPWGGGKTAFASFLATILNPYCFEGPLPGWFRHLPIADQRFWPKADRRPWHVIHFNAWRHQHVKPPWWVFYDAVRRHCAKAAMFEVNKHTEALPPVSDSFYKRNWALRRFQGFGEWILELSWRVWTPDFRVKLLLSTITIGTVAGLFLSGIVRFGEKGIELALGSAGHTDGSQSVWLTPLVVFFAGAPTVWAVVSGMTQTLFLGTPEAAKNYSLGAGDPLDRFRHHFAKIIERFRRPILVIVDDLDRCDPDYVVELIRGIQTILTSPRVIFVLLGDKDWIEHAFCEVHKAMKGIEVGKEHEFGGRFVEKAIQFSFVLPEISGPMRRGYVRGLLQLSDEGDESGEEETGLNIQLNSGRAAEALNEQQEAVLNLKDYEKREIAAAKFHETTAFSRLNQAQKEEVLRRFRERLALRAAADVSAEKATSHMIEALVPLLPPNPRQIKRIVNAISLIQEVARLGGLAQPGTPAWQVLARWVVLMIEWPKTWFTLSTFPVLADRALGSTSAEGDLPENADDILKVLMSNTAAIRLLKFCDEKRGWVQRDINQKEIEWLCQLMPPTSGRLLKSLET